MASGPNSEPSAPPPPPPPPVLEEDDAAADAQLVRLASPYALRRSREPRRDHEPPDTVEAADEEFPVPTPLAAEAVPASSALRRN